ncbi:uncharacterized protein LOC111089315 [Limulus polyphemus]|uniref:Uncharacterized protein LOC111089315 n=1 Tax=Limulus polyphemus TaxID=6850 RepID=A0ABM1TN37_LIMPO|nr:uncharacterized protein LOC111089315 [Limulus polyphemus]
MSIITMAYVLPMMLGRTFDTYQNSAGRDIFTITPENITTISAPKTKTIYRRVESFKEARDFLDISGELSLNILADKVNVQGSGQYLKDFTSSSKYIEYVVNVNFETVTERISESAKPEQNWTSYSNLGTHFVRAITYGGNLVASLRFILEDESFKEEISGELNFVLGKGGDGTQLKGKLDKFEENLASRVSLQIYYYSDVGLYNVPTSISGFDELLKGFKTAVQDVNNGKGVPIKVELVDLKAIGGGEEYIGYKELVLVLQEVEQKFVELKEVKDSLIEWWKELPVGLEKETEEDIDRFYRKITTILEKFYISIVEMHPKKGKTQFDEANKAYKEGSTDRLPGTYRRELRKLQKNLDIKGKTLLDVYSSTYVHWGKSSCYSANTEKLYSGYAATHPEEGIGGGANYLCYPEDNLAWGEECSSSDQTFLGTLRLGTINNNSPLNTSKTLFQRSVVCALCHITNRSSVVTFLLENECPEGWITEYKGYLVTNENNGHRGEYVCLDTNIEIDELKRGIETNANRFMLDQKANLVILPPESNTDSHTKNRFVACIVCTK